MLCYCKNSAFCCIPHSRPLKKVALFPELFVLVSAVGINGEDHKLSSYVNPNAGAPCLQTGSFQQGLVEVAQTMEDDE